MQLAFPLQIDQRGRTAEANTDRHLHDLIEQVLFTAPGERVNRPAFGSGLMQLVFEPTSTELIATVQYLVQGALQQWLGDLIEVRNVQVSTNESTLAVTIDYIIRHTQEQKIAQFLR